MLLFKYVKYVLNTQGFPQGHQQWGRLLAPLGGIQKVDLSWRGRRAVLKKLTKTNRGRGWSSLSVHYLCEKNSIILEKATRVLSCSRFLFVFWSKISFSCKNKSVWINQTPLFAKIGTGNKQYCYINVVKKWRSYFAIQCSPHVGQIIILFKNILLFFNYELKTSCKKGDAGSHPFQWYLIILIHLAGLYTGTIFNSIARKILPQGWNQFFSSKKELAWKSCLDRKWGTKFQLGGLPKGRLALWWGDLVNVQVVVGVGVPHPNTSNALLRCWDVSTWCLTLKPTLPMWNCNSSNV